MTLRKAEVIVGYDIDLMQNQGKKEWVAEANLFEIDEIASATGKTREDALCSLVEISYRLVCRKVFQAQKWRCWECGGLKPLQGDHITPRARGRVDRGNIRGLCAECHERRHKHRYDSGN